MCDVANHKKQKVEVQEAMVDNMAPVGKYNKFAAYEAPALLVVACNGEFDS
jgi:hypothetical protein